MVRQAYLIPRVIIIALIALACWVGSDPLIRRAVVNKIQQTTGAQVEIGHLRYSLSNHKIFLKDVTIADPHAPMRNLFQAEMVYAELDPASLLRRQIVIENGQSSDIVFGSPRTASGAIEQFPIPKQEEFQWTPKPFQSIQEIGLVWLDGLQPNHSITPSLDNLKLVQASQGTLEFWQKQLTEQSSVISELAESKTRLQAQRESSRNWNPLRKDLVNNEAEFTALATQTKAIETRLLELQRLAAEQRAALVSSHQHDLQQLRNSIHTTSFDSDVISRLLLTRLQEERVAEAIGWFQWFRHAVPDPKTDFRLKNKRGIDILFPGVEPQPSFLIKSIELEGEGRFANQHINFAGSAHNLTSEPEYHHLPASFEVRAQGAHHMIVSCILDRRNDSPSDSLNVVCPDLEIPSQRLGEERSMLVTMGPASHIQADIQIHAEGDQITGELVFRHSNVSLHVEQIHEMAGGEETAFQLNQGLAAVDRFETRVTLSGSLSDYEFQFQSDLGSRFASAANQLLAEKSARKLAKGTQELDEFLASQLRVLDQRITPELRDMLQQLQRASIEIASIREALPAEKNRLNKMR